MEFYKKRLTQLVLYDKIIRPHVQGLSRRIVLRPVNSEIMEKAGALSDVRNY